MDNQRLRTLTTGKLHTDISYVYEDLEAITGQSVMTHMIPNMMKAVRPWLVKHVPDPCFWNNIYDPIHIGDYPLPIPTDEECQAMRDLYYEQPDPLDDKEVVVVVT